MKARFSFLLFLGLAVSLYIVAVRVYDWRLNGYINRDSMMSENRLVAIDLAALAAFTASTTAEVRSACRQMSRAVTSPTVWPDENDQAANRVRIDWGLRLVECLETYSSALAVEAILNARWVYYVHPPYYSGGILQSGTSGTYESDRALLRRAATLRQK